MPTTIEVNKQSVEALLGSGKSKPFVIPEYQRPYAWTDEQVETLFEDLWDFTATSGGTERESSYFLGSVVSYENEDGEQEIIDGQQRMGLTTWADAPDGKIKKSDVTVAKNYLSQDEMKQLNRMVTAYLDFAENMTLRHIPLTMQDWEKRLNSFIEMFDYGILQDAGKVSAEIAKLHAETEFEKYRVIQDSLFMSDFDRYMLELEESAKK